MFVRDNVFTCYSRTSSRFGACYRSSSPENPATSSRRFVLQTFIFLPRLDESGISWHQPDLNLRQIWWFGTFPKNYNIGLSITGKVDVVANASSRNIYYCSILIEEVCHLPIRISQDYRRNCSLWILVLPKSDLLLDVLDTKPHLMGYARTSRRTLEAEY